jgi:hypothetical protein
MSVAVSGEEQVLEKTSKVIKKLQEDYPDLTVVQNKASPCTD